MRTEVAICHMSYVIVIYVITNFKYTRDRIFCQFFYAALAIVLAPKPAQMFVLGGGNPPPPPSTLIPLPMSLLGYLLLAESVLSHFVWAFKTMPLQQLPFFVTPEEPSLRADDN